MNDFKRRRELSITVDQMEPVTISSGPDFITVAIVDRLTARGDIDDFMGKIVAIEIMPRGRKLL